MYIHTYPRSGESAGDLKCDKYVYNYIYLHIYIYIYIHTLEPERTLAIQIAIRGLYVCIHVCVQ